MQNQINTGLVERNFRLAVVFSILLSLSACAAVDQTTWDPLSRTAESGGLDTSLSNMTPAVQRLIQQADRAINENNWFSAISILERALRINPGQAETWSRLSVAHYGGQQYQQAIQMARRSNSYINNNDRLKAYNWLMMSRAYEQLGDMEQSRKARQTSQALQQGRP